MKKNVSIILVTTDSSGRTHKTKIGKVNSNTLLHHKNLKEINLQDRKWVLQFPVSRNLKKDMST